MNGIWRERSRSAVAGSLSLRASATVLKVAWFSRLYIRMAKRSKSRGFNQRRINFFAKKIKFWKYQPDPSLDNGVSQFGEEIQAFPAQFLGLDFIIFFWKLDILIFNILRHIVLPKIATILPVLAINCQIGKFMLWLILRHGLVC